MCDWGGDAPELLGIALRIDAQDALSVGVVGLRRLEFLVDVVGIEHLALQERRPRFRREPLQRRSGKAMDRSLEASCISSGVAGPLVRMGSGNQMPT